MFSVLPIFHKFPKAFGMLRLKYLLDASLEPPRIYPIPFKTLPRMQLVGGWEVVPDPSERLRTLLGPGFDPGEKVLLESPPSFPSNLGKPGGTVVWNEISTDEVEIAAETVKPCLLLVTDNFASGWRVLPFPGSVQQSYPIMPGDYFLRAIPLTSGKHHFRMMYEPVAFEVGKWVSGGSLLVYLGLLFWAFRKPRPALLRV